MPLSRSWKESGPGHLLRCEERHCEPTAKGMTRIEALTMKMKSMVLGTALRVVAMKQIKGTDASIISHVGASAASLSAV